jgi:sodium-dependent dicarboxylate transporter 2/3/5
MNKPFQILFSKNAWIVIAPLVSLAIIMFANLDPGNPKVTYTFALAFLMAAWWITEAVPIPVTSLLPVALFPFFGIVDGTKVSSLYFNHVIFLFIGGFLMAFAMERWNLHRRIALKILINIGISPGRLLFGFMLATAFLSMWMSNTATTMMMLPIVISLISKLEESLGKEALSRYSVGLLLCIAYAASIGGIATLVGTPPNLSFMRITSILYPAMNEISFTDWLIFAFPMTFILFIACWLILFFMFRPKSGSGWENLRISEFKEEYKALGKIGIEEKTVLVLFVTLVLLWVFRSEINIQSVKIPGWETLFKGAKGINDGTVAIFISFLLFLIPSKQKKGEQLMNWETAKKIPWGIILLFGGGFALAQGFVDSGLSQWFGDQMSGLSGVHPVYLTLANVSILATLTEFTSNTATVEMILPILSGLSNSIQINPLLLMIPATVAASLAFMLPVATPPNAIVFGSNRLRILDMIKAGILLDLAGIIIVTVFMYFWGTVVFGIDVNVFPEWAIPK